MGLQGPLTAQALGRSPYDDVVEGEGQEDYRHPGQQFDHRGRPINPETKRINRDIIRSHNEVMLVVGVAEPDNLHDNIDVASKLRHRDYEESTGKLLATYSKFCVDAVGVFGILGLRQRILIYKEYSEIPFRQLFQQTRQNLDIRRDVLAGAATSFMTEYLEGRVVRLWSGEESKALPRKCVHEMWSWVRVHLELYATCQRLGLVSYTQLYPSLSYFIPFTHDSPIPPPPPLEAFDCQSLFNWGIKTIIGATPFVAWVMAQRLVKAWRPTFWSRIVAHLPNSMSHGRGILPPTPPPTTPALPPPPPPPPPESEGIPIQTIDPNAVVDDADLESLPVGGEIQDFTEVTADPSERPDFFHPGGDDYGSDEDDQDVPQTMVTFDVEATESAEVPPGVWSAELRPSAASDSRSADCPLALTLDTTLTRIPALVASKILTEGAIRFAVVPFEATALRMVARMIRIRQGLPFSDIHGIAVGFVNGTMFTNWLATELLQLSLQFDVWAAFTFLSDALHRSEAEWEKEEAEEAEEASAHPNS